MAAADATMTTPDSKERRTALTDHKRTLLVEAGAGTGKTALIAGRVALLVAAGTHPRDIVAITFTEAAASKLRERIEGFVASLSEGDVPHEIQVALPEGLTEHQKDALGNAKDDLNQITCTTIHSFCRQLIRPYPVETTLDPSAKIIDSTTADLTYDDLMNEWLLARLGRSRGSDSLGRIPSLPDAEGEENLFAALIAEAPDKSLESLDGLIKLIKGAALFIKDHRTARITGTSTGEAASARFRKAVDEFSAWYDGCGVDEPETAEIIMDLQRVAELADRAAEGAPSNRLVAKLVFHRQPSACKKGKPEFTQWRAKTRWKKAVKQAGKAEVEGERLSVSGEPLYNACDEAYGAFRAYVGDSASRRFFAEFDAFRDLYRDYKRNTALLDFDDLLHHARDLIKDNEPVRKALAKRYPRILVDEFQDTDPLQAEVLWRLAGDGDAASPWNELAIRPGALFLVGDPKQAIYRFRGADIQTYYLARNALAASGAGAVIEVTANFRTREPILDFVNETFAEKLAVSQGRPSYTALQPTRPADDQRCLATFHIPIDDRHRDSKGTPIVDQVRRQEASAVADIVRDLLGTHHIQGRGDAVGRPARAGDIALLSPAGTGIPIYEDELERRGIPVASQAGKGLFQQQEVQDLIAICRVIADPRDTLAFGALIRGPLVGLTDEQIADEVEALHAGDGAEDRSSLNPRTDPARVGNTVLQQTLRTLQSLARKARRTTPYHVLAEAVEELHIRPILKTRQPAGAERALANVELLLEMARAFAARGMGDLAQALRQRWKDEVREVEAGLDAENDAVSIITMHSAKGLEWPIVIPVNSTTKPWSGEDFLYRHSDDSVHFKTFGHSSPDYDSVRERERREQRNEHVRLWYVTLTRAEDLLLLPRQDARIENDWFSLLGADLEALPPFGPVDPARPGDARPEDAADSPNKQDPETWKREEDTIAAGRRSISWSTPSLHEEPSEADRIPVDKSIGTEAGLGTTPDPAEEAHALGGRERGRVLHKLMEEALTGEAGEAPAVLRKRAAELIAQLGIEDAPSPEDGPCSAEIAETVERTLRLPDIAELRPRLRPEYRVYAGGTGGRKVSLTSGIADAVAMDDAGDIEVVIDWKSDVAPRVGLVELYRGQLRDYLRATGASRGLLVFVTSGSIEEVTATD